MEINPLLSNWVETLIFRRLKQCKFVKFSESDERGLTQQEMAVVKFTFYGLQEGKPDSVFTPPQILQSRDRTGRFWHTVRSLGWGWWK
jgi:hypothetical protein